MRKVGLVIAVALAAVLFLLLLLVASTVPSRSGTVRLTGPRAGVRIETDARGVVTVRAASAADALFGLGYAHARDRLWQMEFQRRIAAGRLAEVLGPRLVPTDRFLRTIGFRRAAAASLPRLSPAFRRRLAAYAAGVNAYLATSRVRAVEFRLLRVEPEPFDETDCIAWAKLMAWDLAGNAAGEIRRSRLVRALGAARAAELLAPAPASPAILEEGEWAPPAEAARERRGARREVRAPILPEEIAAALEGVAALAGGGEDAGSNSWVLAGSRTASGRPLLANDPHLGLRAPSVWYLARLSAPDLSVAGATIPGLPGVVIGSNSRIAWGLTSLEPDVQDLFVEQPDPRDRRRYLWKGRSLPYAVRRERIRVRGGADVVLDLRSSVHGPIVSEVLAGAESLPGPVALAWTALDAEDRTPEAFAGFNTAANWTDFLRAAALLRAPAQNLVYADADGHIGYTASGAVPVRPRADGLLPVRGDGADDWTGFVPFERLPRVLDPPRGYLVTANNRVVPGAAADAFSRDWAEPYRARRITERILAAGKLDARAAASIQLDEVSLLARELLPLLSATRPRDAASRDALSRLRNWSGETSADSVPAAIFAAWFAALARMPADELGGVSAGTTRSRFVVNALAADSAWCDDVRTRPRETCADFAASALGEAVRALAASLGSDPAGWRWGRLHRATLPHGVFGSVPILRGLFSLSAARGGDRSTVNVGAYALDGSFAMTDGPSYRQILDFGRPEESLFVHTTGQSGNPFEPRYRDLLPLWRRGGYVRLGGAAQAVLTLEPRETPRGKGPGRGQ